MRNLKISDLCLLNVKDVYLSKHNWTKVIVQDVLANGNITVKLENGSEVEIDRKDLISVEDRNLYWNDDNRFNQDGYSAPTVFPVKKLYFDEKLFYGDLEIANKREYYHQEFLCDQREEAMESIADEDRDIPSWEDEV